MEFNNPFTLNDWSIRSLLYTVALIQLFVWALIALGALGFEVPILRQVLVFIYLLLIPGFLLLRTLRVHKLGSVETLLYAVGLSIATLMFIGLVINLVLPWIGINTPLSLLPVTAAVAVFVLVFSVLSYVRDKDYSDTEKWDFVEISSPSCLFFVLLPFVSAIGAFMMNVYGINVLTLLLLLTIASVFVVLISSKRVSSRIYPLAVFSISLSLLLHWSLISHYLFGYDIQVEYFVAHQIVQNAIWTPSLTIDYNSVLSIVMLAPILSLMSGLSLTWVFKIVYPLIFSLVPVCLFWLYNKQIGYKLAFVAVAFFMSFTVFFESMSGLARQEIAEIFLALTLLLIIDTKIESGKKSGLFLIFLASIAVSHYALSYIFMFILASALILLSIQKGVLTKLKAKRLSLFGIADKKKGSVKRGSARGSLVTLTLTSLFIVFALSWYMAVSSGSQIDKLELLGQQISGSLLTDFLSSSSSQGAAIIVSQPSSPLHSVTKYMSLISLGAIMIGFVATWFKPTTRFNREISAFFLPVIVLLVSAIAVPFLARALQTERLIHIGLFFVAPLFALGVIAVVDLAKGVRAAWRTKSSGDHSLVLVGLSVFLALFLLLNSGLIYEVAHDNPNSVALSKPIEIPVYNDMEVAASLWVQHNVPPNAGVYADGYHAQLFYAVMPGEVWIIRSHGSVASYNSSKLVPSGSYVFLGSTNIINKALYVPDVTAMIKQYASVDWPQAGDSRSVLYDNGGAQLNR